MHPAKSNQSTSRWPGEWWGEEQDETLHATYALFIRVAAWRGLAQNWILMNLISDLLWAPAAFNGINKFFRFRCNVAWPRVRFAPPLLTRCIRLIPRVNNISAQLEDRSSVAFHAHVSHISETGCIHFPASYFVWITYILAVMRFCSLSLLCFVLLASWVCFC